MVRKLKFHEEKVRNYKNYPARLKLIKNCQFKFYLAAS